jgi:hypothetical protein
LAPSDSVTADASNRQGQLIDDALQANHSNIAATNQLSVTLSAQKTLLYTVRRWQKITTTMRWHTGQNDEPVSKKSTGAGIQQRAEDSNCCIPWESA